MKISHQVACESKYHQEEETGQKLVSTKLKRDPLGQIPANTSGQGDIRN